MMLRLLIDQDLDQDILRGLAQRIQGLDAITAYEAGLSEATDLEFLAWAATEGRIIVSHDRKTMPGHAAERMAKGEPVAGVIIVSRRLPIKRVLDDLEMIVSCSEPVEWENVIRSLPL